MNYIFIVSDGKNKTRIKAKDTQDALRKAAEGNFFLRGATLSVDAVLGRC